MGRYVNNKDGTKTLIAGRGNTDAIESQIGYVEATDTAVSAHAIGSYFINKTGQFVKTTTAIAVGDTISVGTGANDNCVATDIAGVLSELNSNSSMKLLTDGTWYTATSSTLVIVGVYASSSSGAIGINYKTFGKSSGGFAIAIS